MAVQLQSHSSWNTGSQGIVNTAGSGQVLVALRTDVAGDHILGNARIPLPGTLSLSTPRLGLDYKGSRRQMKPWCTAKEGDG